MSSNYDTVEPSDKWVFDKTVTDCFENMLERSIPQYKVMRNCVTDLAFDAITAKPRKQTFQILDLGCSNGLMLESLVSKFEQYELEHYGYYTGVDVSEPMLDNARARFAENSCVKILNLDLRESFPVGHYDCITSVLTLQFVPINYRQDIIQRVYDNLASVNGTFLMVEKVLGNSAQLNNLFVSNYHRYKEQHGYSKEQIERKKLSLEGVLVPVTNDWNIELLKQAGFRQVDVFWRWMNFVGYIAIK